MMEDISNTDNIYISLLEYSIHTKHNHDIIGKIILSSLGVGNNIWISSDYMIISIFTPGIKIGLELILQFDNMKNINDNI